MVKRYITEKKQGSFLDIMPLESDFFKISLEEVNFKIINETKKITTIISENISFNLKINTSNIKGGEDLNLSKELKSAFKMNWAPYSYTTKEYNYFPSKNLTLEEKKETLLNIFSVLKDFEESYQNKVEVSKEVFSQDMLNDFSFSNVEFIVKYNREKNNFMIISLQFMGPEKYKKLRAASYHCDKIDKDFNAEFLKDLLRPKQKILGKTYFEILPERYLEIKDLVNSIKQEKEDFIENQQSYVVEYEKDPFMVEEKNIFDLKIIPHKEKGLFEFYCKGYKKPADNLYRALPRGLLSKWALNTILTSNPQPGDNEQEIDYDIIDGRKKIILSQRNEAKELKTVWIAFEDYPKLKLIYENYQKEMLFWNRPTTVLKFKAMDIRYESAFPGINLNSEPSLFFNEKGKAYFIYAIKYLMKKNKEVQDNNLDSDGYSKVMNIEEDMGYNHLSAIEINAQEVDNFLNHHPLSDKILKNSVFVTSQLYLKKNLNNDNNPITLEDRQNVFDKAFNVFKLKSLTNELSPKTVKSSRMKI